MKLALSGSLILASVLPLLISLDSVLASPAPASETLLLAKERGGGNRGARSGSGANRSANRGSGGRSLDRSSVGAGGSGRVNRSSSPNRASAPNRDRGSLNRSQVGASGSGRINREQPRTATRSANVDGNRARERSQSADRSRSLERDPNRNRLNGDGRDINLSNDRDFSGRVGRTVVNTGNRNIVVNPRSNTWGGAAWGWNGGRVWAPNYGYWGGGFWGGVALGAVATGVTSAVINAASQPDYIVIEQNSPGYTLFESYGLTQVGCVENSELVYIYGPQDSLICAAPNEMVAAGYYEVNPDDLSLIYRD